MPVGPAIELKTERPRTLAWVGGAAGRLRIIDQTRLPAACTAIDCTTIEQVWEAIRSLRVRGAPAIGVAAAYGTVLGLQKAVEADRPGFDRRLGDAVEYLSTSRPTAVNLFWALDRLRGVARTNPQLSSREMLERLLAEARTIEREDREMCGAIGEAGAALLSDGDAVLTHCNAGSLATAGDGTALSVIYAACGQGKRIRVYADETRPLLQGARLTAWELSERSVPVTLICDSTAGWIMKEGRVQVVITGADRIAANGDAANKIGTYSVALLAGAHGIPFYIAAPSSTFDLSRASGEDIPIEERAPDEITGGKEGRNAPDGVEVYNPAFDVTPAECITAIVTERGLIRPVNAKNVREVLGR